MADDFLEQETLRDTLRSLTAEDRARVETDITLAEVLAYHAGEMSTDAADELRERLSLNPVAARLVADLASFPDLEIESEESAATHETENEPDGPVYEAAEVASLSMQSSRLRKQSSRAWLLAAVFATTALGLAIWLAAVHQELGEQAAPRGNLKVYTLSSIDTVRHPGTATPVDRIKISDWNEGLVLLIPLPAESSPEIRFRADVSGSGKLLWSAMNLVSDEYQQLSLEWPRRALEPGEYRLEVSPASGSRHSTRFEIRLESP